MGKALEWIGPDGCQGIAEQLLEHIEVRSGELWAACPFHSETTMGNAFSYSWDKDQCYCNSCGAKGDLISIYGAVHGLDDRQAFVEFRNIHAPHIQPLARPVLRTPRTKSAPQARVDEAPILPPSDLWQAQAQTLVTDAHQILMRNQKQLAWLAQRGIKPTSVARHKLGWIPEAMFRPRSSWGLEPRFKDSGQAKKLWIPAGLVIPWMDGEQVLRVRIRQPEGEPKYLVLEGSAKSPAPLMFLRDHWTGPSHACVVVEAELDAILLFQEIGDLASVLAVGSALVMPEDQAALEFCQSMAWFGLWLDRDQAGDKAVIKWTDALHRPGDGGFASALGAGVADMRPMGTGKQDPGDYFGSGQSIREHVLDSLPMAWRMSAGSPDGSGKQILGDGGLEPVSLIPASVREMYRLLSRAPMIAVVRDDLVSIAAYRRRATGEWVRDEQGHLVQDVEWEHMHWDLARAVARLFWYDQDVQEFLSLHPDAGVGVSARNFWKGLPGEGK